MCTTTYTRTLCNTCGFMIAYNMNFTECSLKNSRLCHQQQDHPVVRNTKVPSSYCKKCKAITSSRNEKIS
ncbi:hypothetical protein CEP53_010264 [Fusarium sp. AF-6]|nr:hypothetical protein CEP53_010264 [Fusarium sp. AF-6]